MLFDCIEFNDDFACIDVLYDLAFLLMDLLDRGLDAAAQRVLQGYVERTLEGEGLALLPLFIGCRARDPRQGRGVCGGGRGCGADRERHERRARHYLDARPTRPAARAGRDWSPSAGAPAPASRRWPRPLRRPDRPAARCASSCAAT